MMNGYFFDQTVDFFGDGNLNIISCFFINCSNRAFCIQNDKTFLTINFCSFVQCTYLEEDQPYGGSFYSDCSSFSLSKTRFIDSEVYERGIAFYNIANDNSIKMISIIKNIYYNKSHYCFYTLGKNYLHTTNINVSNIETRYDVGIETNISSTWRFVNLESLSGRTLFRSKLTLHYFNIMNCSLQHFLFDCNVTLKSGYFYCVWVNTSFSFNKTSVNY